MTIAFRHLVKKPNGDTEIGQTGIRVYTILDCHRSGEAPEEIAGAYDIPLAAVYEALAYAEENPDEMEAIERADDAATRKLHARLPE
ncbi:DUF433 domain-containing protein, partial [Piscinibacter sp.]|uniref:DUF433 domain-containing protein n=1 Tax=Piscinibacter sp. TaxID=1903157 RepID=UPI002CA4E066